VIIRNEKGKRGHLKKSIMARMKLPWERGNEEMKCAVRVRVRVREREKLCVFVVIGRVLRGGGNKTAQITTFS